MSTSSSTQAKVFRVSADQFSETSSNGKQPDTLRLIRWFTPSLLDVFFCALLVGIFAQPHGIVSLLSDGDTGWHIRTGQLALQTGAIPQRDPFSFSLPRSAWFAWEWLADVLFALLWNWRGLAGVAAFSGCILAAAATAILARLLRQGSGLWIGLVVSLAAVSASSVHYLARPHVFSILFYTVALWVLAEDRQRQAPLLWLLVPLTALWVNLHGGFVAWLVTLGLLVAEYAAGRAWRGVRRYGLLGALCALASLANPHGWQLHLHVVRYLNSSWIMDHVAEFQSPLIRSEGMIVFAVLLLAAVALVSTRRPIQRNPGALLGLLALRSARHVPFFAMVAAPVVASAAAHYWSLLAERAGGNRLSESSGIWPGIGQLSPRQPVAARDGACGDRSPRPCRFPRRAFPGACRRT